MSTPTSRCVARALRPDVIEAGAEDPAPLQAGEMLVRVAAAKLRHAER